MNDSRVYALGRTDQEHQRLADQARLLAAMTRRFFEAAGIRSGMRVLDLGCGVGDVGMLAAEMVGAEGRVVCIDMDGVAVDKARERAHRAGLHNIDFEVGDVAELEHSANFDAVVGRFVLLYVPDPLAMIKAAARALRPGGVIAFHELAYWPMPPNLVQHLPTGQRVGYWVMETLRRSGAHVDVGNRLAWLMLDAGFPKPSLRMEVLADLGDDSPLIPYIVATMRSLMPKAVEYGVTTEPEVDLDTLEERLRDEHLKTRSILGAAPSYFAWSFKR